MLPPNRWVEATVLWYQEVRLLDEVMRVEPQDGISVLIKQRRVQSPFSVSVSLCLSVALCLSVSLSLTCEETARRQPSGSQEESSHQSPTILIP